MLKAININPWNYLVGKIFIWFWIVIFSVITVTTVVVHQLDPAPEFFHLKQRHISHLKKVAHHLAQSPEWTNAPKTALTQPPHVHQRPFIVLSKSKKTLYSNIRLPRGLRDKHLFRLADSKYPQSVHFGDIKIKGPLSFSAAGQEYQVFSIAVPRHRTPSARIRDLPLWIRILVPLVLSSILSYLLARSLATPILKLRKSTQQLAEGDLNTRCSSVASRKDELGKLGQDFDRMAAKLSRLVSAQQRLLGDVSHELRSPLARLKLATGMLPDADENTRATLLLQIERESDRLDTMLGDVLRLSRLESQLNLPEPEPITLSTLLGAIIDGIEIEAKASNKQIVVEANSSVTVFGSPVLLASAIENVLRNAIKYTSENSIVEVTLSVDTTNECANITIEDYGPGIKAGNEQQIFEPFYRESNSRTRQTGGTGLGLAISKRAITQHGGEISAKNATSHSGLIITITLPVKN